MLVAQIKSDTWIIFSPLFASFIQEQNPPSKTSTHINYALRIAQLNGKHIENLTELAFELLYYLYEHREKICTKDELIENIYRQQYKVGRGLSDEMLHALISRLRKKVAMSLGHDHCIVTIRGQGYKFVLPKEP